MATLAVLTALGYGIENWRGWRAWTAERDRLLARGQQLDFTALLPPDVPDAGNFALIPPLRPLFDYGADVPGRWRDTNGFQRAMQLLQFLPPAAMGREPDRAFWDRGQTTDLPAWQKHLRSQPRKVTTQRGSAGTLTNRLPVLPAEPQAPARDVLAGLQALGADFDTLTRAVRESTHARFPIHYEEAYSALLPHLALLKRCTLRFGLRASAGLADGRIDAAFEDLETALRLPETVRDEPFLISQLVRQVGFDIALQPLWEGVVTHAWTEPQIAVVQAQLAATDLFGGWRRAIEMERAGILRMVEEMTQSRRARREFGSLLLDLAPDNAPLPSLVPVDFYLVYAPRGWLYASLTETSRALDELLAVTPRQVPTLHQIWKPVTQPDSVRLLLHNQFLGRKDDVNLADSYVRTVRFQTHLQLALTACALERHRLAQGVYPDRLEALVPRYLPALPPDLVSGQPLRYRAESGDRFRLWSVGADGKDDDGAFPPAAARKGKRVEAAGDWVWRWPGTEAP